jgi:hypothetical protein
MTRALRDGTSNLERLAMSEKDNCIVQLRRSDDDVDCVIQALMHSPKE